jgi:hypothetical protein
MSQVNSREIVTTAPEVLMNTRPEVLKGLVAGTIGGLVASWVMEEFQSAWFKLSKRVGKSESGESSSANTSESSSANNGGESQNGGAEPATTEAEPATVKAAEFVSEKIFGHRLAKDEKKIAGDAVHYATGAASGAVYGVAAELAPEVTAGAGLPFGTAVWLVVDEAAVPLLGLAKGPTEYPLSTHVYALASHFVYGISTEVVRSALRKTILR